MMDVLFSNIFEINPTSILPVAMALLQHCRPIPSFKNHIFNHFCNMIQEIEKNNLENKLDGKLVSEL